MEQLEILYGVVGFGRDLKRGEVLSDTKSADALRLLRMGAARIKRTAATQKRGKALPAGTSTAKPYGVPEDGGHEKYPKPAKGETRGPWPKGGNFLGK